MRAPTRRRRSKPPQPRSPRSRKHDRRRRAFHLVARRNSLERGIANRTPACKRLSASLPRWPSAGRCLPRKPRHGRRPIVERSGRGRRCACGTAGGGGEPGRGRGAQRPHVRERGHTAHEDGVAAADGSDRDPHLSPISASAVGRMAAVVDTSPQGRLRECARRGTRRRLDVPIDEAAPVHWRRAAAARQNHPLPHGTTSLADVVDAPRSLTRRRPSGASCRAKSAASAGPARSGQRLVSREGDLWRWDG